MHIIGIDVSKRTLHAGYLVDAEREKIHQKRVENTPEGHARLLRWAERQSQAPRKRRHFILEATGVYHEALAEALHAAGARVSVVNPAQVRYFAKSRGIVTKSDAHDRRVLALFGAERRPRAWQPSAPETKQLKALLARLEVLEQEIQREQNRREQAELTHQPPVLESIAIVIGGLKDEHRRLRRAIDDHIDRHPRLAQDRALLASIPGVGEKLAQHLLVLLSGQRFRSGSQAGAFVGLAPRQHDSGTSVRQPPRLTKKGDARLRARLYLPAIVAITHNPDVAALAQRLRRAGKAPKACIAAAMRKLVHIAFGVLKNQTPYQPQCA